MQSVGWIEQPTDASTYTHEYTNTYTPVGPSVLVQLCFFAEGTVTYFTLMRALMNLHVYIQLHQCREQLITFRASVCLFVWPKPMNHDVSLQTSLFRERLEAMRTHVVLLLLGHQVRDLLHSLAATLPTLLFSVER
jgi:hypothetical protein